MPSPVPTEPVARIGARGLSKSFGSVVALRDVSFDVAGGEIRALCGENGAGKSTLVKLLTGVHRPDAGAVTVGGQAVRIANPRQAERLGVALVAQELSLCPALSVLDNIWLGSVQVPLLHRSRRLRARARDALVRLGMGHLDLDRLAGTLSLGERQLVEIARMLTRDAGVLILDEPSATLSDIEITRMFAALRALRREGRAIIYITHRLAEVFAICDSATVLLNGAVVGTEAVAALSRDRLIEMMLGRTLADMYPASAPQAGLAGLVVDDLAVPGAVSGISLRASAGSIVGIAGQVGSGAAELVAALAGLAWEATGQVTLHGRRLRLGDPAGMAQAGVRFIAADRAAEGIFTSLSVRRNLVATSLARHSRLGLVNRAALRRAANALAARVGIDPRRLGARAGTLSGGNQQKLAFARCLEQESVGMLVMHEPTRGIDVGARADIYRLMRQFCDAGHVLVMASTDLEEILGVADIVVTLYRGRVVGQYRRGAATMHRLVADITHPEAIPP